MCISRIGENEKQIIRNDLSNVTFSGYRKLKTKKYQVYMFFVVCELMIENSMDITCVYLKVERYSTKKSLSTNFSIFRFQFLKHFSSLWLFDQFKNQARVRCGLRTATVIINKCDSIVSVRQNPKTTAITSKSTA